MDLVCHSQTSQRKLDEIFNKTYHQSIISRGDNIPDFDRKKDNIDRFLVSMYCRIPPSDFMRKAGWSENTFDDKVKLLTEKGWLKKDGDNLTPTVFIVSGEMGSRLYEYAGPVSAEIASAIEESVPMIKEKFSKEGLAAKYNYEELAFLILSDVLLDNWQLMNMESTFLKQENRPERHGKFYYASIMENSGNGYEPFKIYGNQSGKINDTVWLNIYGNNRIVANRKLADKNFCDSVFANSIRVTMELDTYFNEIASDFRPKLLKILEKNRDYSLSVFRKTGYAEQIRFEEFFIWWYHFIYTETTNILASKKILKIPESGNFYYL